MKDQMKGMTRSEFTGTVEAKDGDQIIVSQTYGEHDLMALQICPGDSPGDYTVAYLSDQQARMLANVIDLYLATEKDGTK